MKSVRKRSWMTWSGDPEWWDEHGEDFESEFDDLVTYAGQLIRDDMRNGTFDDSRVEESGGRRYLTVDAVEDYSAMALERYGYPYNDEAESRISLELDGDAEKYGMAEAKVEKVAKPEFVRQDSHMGVRYKVFRLPDGRYVASFGKGVAEELGIGKIAPQFDLPTLVHNVEWEIDHADPGAFADDEWTVEELFEGVDPLPDEILEWRTSMRRKSSAPQVGDVFEYVDADAYDCYEDASGIYRVVDVSRYPGSVGVECIEPKGYGATGEICCWDEQVADGLIEMPRDGEKHAGAFSRRGSVTMNVGYDGGYTLELVDDVTFEHTAPVRVSDGDVPLGVEPGDSYDVDPQVLWQWGVELDGSKPDPLAMADILRFDSSWYDENTSLYRNVAKRAGVHELPSFADFERGRLGNFFWTDGEIDVTIHEEACGWEWSVSKHGGLMGPFALASGSECFDAAGDAYRDFAERAQDGFLLNALTFELQPACSYAKRKRAGEIEDGEGGALEFEHELLEDDPEYIECWSLFSDDYDILIYHDGYGYFEWVAGDGWGEGWDPEEVAEGLSEELGEEIAIKLARVAQSAPKVKVKCQNCGREFKIRGDYQIAEGYTTRCSDCGASASYYSDSGNWDSRFMVIETYV